MAAEEDASELIARHATDELSAPPAAPTAPPAPSAARGAMLVTAGIILSRLFGLILQRIVGHYFWISALSEVVVV